MAVALAASVPVLAQAPPGAPQKPKAPPEVLSCRPDPSLQRRIDSKTGFCGGDAAYSIPLSNGTTVWLFGDSFRGKIVGGKRTGCRMERNCVAVDKPQQAGGKLKYYFGKRDFFICREEDGTNYYWPGDGIEIDGRLYLFQHTVKTDRQLPAPFQFKMRDNHIIVVLNPKDSPDKWVQRVFRLKQSAGIALLSVACYQEGDYLYMFNSYTGMAIGTVRNPTALSRIKLCDLAQINMKEMEWWSGKWVKARELPEILFEDGASEMSVVRIEGLKGLYCFYIPSDRSAIMVRTAMRPEGPWSPRKEVYKFPRDPELFYYSVKAHPEYKAGPGKIKLTYNVNSLHLKRLMEDDQVYFPKALEVTLR